MSMILFVFNIFRINCLKLAFVSPFLLQNNFVKSYHYWYLLVISPSIMLYPKIEDHNWSYGYISQKIPHSLCSVTTLNID